MNILTINENYITVDEHGKAVLAWNCKNEHHEVPLLVVKEKRA